MRAHTPFFITIFSTLSLFQSVQKTGMVITVKNNVSATSTTQCHVTMLPATVPAKKNGWDQHVIKTWMNVNQTNTTVLDRIFTAITPLVDMIVSAMTVMDTMHRGSVWVSCL